MTLTATFEAGDATTVVWPRATSPQAEMFPAGEEGYDRVQSEADDIARSGGMMLAY